MFTQENVIELHQVTKIYKGPGGEVTALNGINLRIGRGEFLVITGKSGSGKTTLVNMITALDRCTSGEVRVEGVVINRLPADRAAKWRGRTLGVVFQSFELLPTLTVLQNVMLPMDFARRYPLRDARQRALDLLEQVGIVEQARKLPWALSGGQQQRVAIARALANDPAILVADEPTGSLDSATASTVIDVFVSLAAQGRTILFVTHDRDIARRGSRVIALLDGEIVDESEGAHV
jgi:putative ABC transport system ATP-binding protein